MDESGISFRKMAARSFRRAVGLRSDRLVQAAVKRNGNLERLTVMAVVNASGCSFNPIVVYLDKQPHYRRVMGKLNHYITISRTAIFINASRLEWKLP